MYTYEDCIQTSERVAWTVDSILGTSGVNFARPFLPETLAQVNGLEFLSQQEKLRLNQIRGLTYVHLFGFVEEFILKKVMELAAGYPVERAVERRALLRFAEEEAKHQLLFERAKQVLLSGLGECGLVGGAGAVADQVLGTSNLCVLMLTSMLEWMTQHHYVEVFSSATERESLDSTFVEIFRSHWIEEAQHTKLDDLELHRAAAEVDAEGREAAVDQLLAVGGAFDGLVKAQAELDIESLQRVIPRKLTPEERAKILTTQHRAYRY